MAQILLNKLPVRFRGEVAVEDFEGLEEIRLRAGRPLELCYGNQNVRLLGEVRSEEIGEMLNYLTGYCLYAYEEEIRQGFFTVEGGHRVGIVGRASTSSGERGVRIEGIRDISGLNLRIAHERKGVGIPIVKYIRDKDSIHNTLFLARPGVGKTTYLRDCIRILSGGADGKRKLKICVVDERSEIAACHNGIPQNDLGERTDVLDNCPKQRGMQMLLRSMSPQIIAVDELGGEEDFRMLFTILYSGSRILGTIHAQNVGEIWEKPYMKLLLSQKIIGRFVLLNMDEQGNRSFCVYDDSLREIG